MTKRDLQADVNELRAKAEGERKRGREQSWLCLTKMADDIQEKLDLELAAEYQQLAE